jgi:hypothetical protein
VSEPQVCAGVGQIYAGKTRVLVKIASFQRKHIDRLLPAPATTGGIGVGQVLHLLLRAMEYFRPVLLFLVLFALNSVFCWLAYDLLLFSPVCGIGLFLPGVLGVVLAVDAMAKGKGQR